MRTHRTPRQASQHPLPSVRLNSLVAFRNTCSSSPPSLSGDASGRSYLPPLRSTPPSANQPAVAKARSGPPARSGEIPLLFSLLPPLDLRTSPHHSTTSDRRARPSIPPPFWSSSLLRSRVYVLFPCQIWVVFGRLRWFWNGCPSLSSLLADWINHCS